MRKLIPLTCILVFIVGCRKEYYTNDAGSSRPTYNYSGKQVRDYFTAICKISKSTPGFFPPQVARAYGYIGLVTYQSVYNGIPAAQSLGGQINGLTARALPSLNPSAEYDWSISANAAIASMIRKMFDINISAQNLKMIDSMEAANLSRYAQYVKPDVVNRSVAYGQSVAEAIYNFSKTDGGDRAYLDPFQLPFVMPQDDYCWTPTGAVLTPVSPFWGNNRAFVQANSSNTQNFTPVAFSTNTTSAFYKQANDVYQQVKKNTAEQVLIAKYWSDDPFNTCTPAGHTFNIMTQLLEENNATLEKTCVAYAKLSIAENDAFIACWKKKYTTNLIRPVTYIKKYIDPNFNTVIGTPPFPAYVSGHSAEIGAGTKIFIDLFTNGSGNYNFTDMSQLQYGFTARHYSNFNDMAKECADSRFYGGIHYNMDNEDGLVQGRAVGDFVNKMIVWPKNLR